MTTLLEIPLRDAAPAVIKAMQEKYPEAVLRIEAENSLHAGSMDEGQFWAIIDLFDWNKKERADIIKPAIEALSKFSESDIHKFHDLLNEKLYALDGKKFATELGSNKYEKGNHFSVDDFLYSRCGVVANGKGFYETVLKEPNKIPKEFTFESLLYVPDKAWQLKTGRDDYGYFPEIWYETFSNSNGWPGITPIKERILNS
ncbi:MAG TPA: DUF4240 domain-containing protein [Bacteroidetes bacterium]|nr:DUF4240 domain-containing protein [Bacteroidota bacterium]